MNDGLFLVANLASDDSLDDLAWACGDGQPYVSIDPLDLLESAEIGLVHELYVKTHSGFDHALNVPMPAALLEFNRWILIRTDKTLVAFACFKTTGAGLKLGLAATDGTVASKGALKRLLRNILTVEGVYAEVSGGIERALAGKVPDVPAAQAGAVLGKPVQPHADGRHYTRDIARIGPRTKLLVGHPRTSDEGVDPPTGPE